MVDNFDNFCLGVWGEVEELRLEVWQSLKAWKDAISEVKGVGDAHQHQGGARKRWPLKDGIQHLLIFAVQLIHLIQHQQAAGIVL